jgi:hypothetical protein
MSAAHLASLNLAKSVLFKLLPASVLQAFVSLHVKSTFDCFSSRSDVSSPSFFHLCGEMRLEQKYLVGHLHKKAVEVLRKQRPAVVLFRVQARSLTGITEWLTAMPHEHDLRMISRLMKWALDTYVRVSLLKPPLVYSRCEQREMDVWGLHDLRSHIGLKHRHDALNQARSIQLGATGRLKSIQPVGVFVTVQDALERPDHGLLANDGQDLFTDTCTVSANDLHMRVVLEEREQVEVNKYSEKCETLSYELLMKSYCLRDISPSRTDNRSDRSPGCRLYYVTEQHVPRISYLKERVRT